MLKKILLTVLAVLLIVVVAGFVYYRLAIYQAPLISESDREKIHLMPLPAEMKL